jgi:ATP-dependent Lon protease
MYRTSAKFDSLLAEARRAGFREIVVPTDGGCDARFAGRLVAEVWDKARLLSGQTAETEDYLFSFSPTMLRLYLRNDGRFVALKADYSDIRKVRRTVKVCDDLDAVVKLFGADALARRFYEQVGIEAVAPLDEPEADAFDAASGEHAEKGEAEDAAQKVAVVADPPNTGAPGIRLFDPALVQQQIDRAKSNEGWKRMVEVLKLLLESGAERRLAQVPPDVLARLGALERRFPNLADALDAMRRQLSLNLLDPNRALRFSPLLLEGPAGVGKTRFAQELADTLEAEFLLIPLNSVTASFVLGGADAQWSSAKPGRVLQFLLSARTANPIMMLDELDKVSGGSGTRGFYDPYAPLYSLLERKTAARFMDEFVQVPVDTSHICWLATGNDLTTVPEPILSRFARVGVNTPRSADMSAIIASVWADLRASEPAGAEFAAELPPETVAKLSAMPPRRLARVLLDAMGNCALENGSETAGPLVILPRHINVEKTANMRRPLGFTADRKNTDGGLTGLRRSAA